MNRLFSLIACTFFLICSCKLMNKKPVGDDKLFAQFLDNYYEQELKFSPLNATQNGDNRYNDLLPIDISESYRDSLRAFYKSYLDSLSQFSRQNMNANDKISFDILKRETRMNYARLNDF